MNLSNRQFAFSFFIPLTLCLLGCQGKSIDHYRPASATARKAIETAMSKWKAGVKHGPITDVTPPLNVFDARWQAGSRLESYEILEEVIGKELPYFKIKLKIAGKPEETTEYLVIGIDPLLVFRDVDYLKASGM